MACRTFLPAGRPICAKASTGLRVPVMGQSFGGWNSLALATMAPPQVKGVVNFVGGIRTSACNRGDKAMFDAMDTFGRDARVPSLWFYGERDSLFSEPVWRTDYEHFTRAGGKAELVDFGDMDDAHNRSVTPAVSTAGCRNLMPIWPRGGSRIWRSILNICRRHTHRRPIMRRWTLWCLPIWPALPCRAEIYRDLFQRALEPAGAGRRLDHRYAGVEADIETFGMGIG